MIETKTNELNKQFEDLEMELELLEEEHKFSYNPEVEMKKNRINMRLDRLARQIGRREI